MAVVGGTSMAQGIRGFVSTPMALSNLINHRVGGLYRPVFRYGNNAPLRVKPSRHSEAMAFLSSTDTFLLVETTSWGWLKVIFKDQIGWISPSGISPLTPT